MKTLSPFVMVLMCAGLAGAVPTVSVAPRAMKTYAFSDPDPVPCIGTTRYPYSRFDGSTAVGVTQNWQTVTLANDRLRVTLTPEIGGKIWGVKDLKTGVDIIYDNQVVKFRDIAMRGPWTSGGIEFNFGIVGHAPSCSTPVDWFVRTNADQSVSCFIASEEYITRTRWQVEVCLYPRSDRFETHTTWFNASGITAPYYHWMNAAYSLRGNPRFLFPGAQWIGHDGDAHPWPRDEKGRDLSVYSNNAFGSHKSYHVLPGDNGFYGIWWPEKKVGSYHHNLACEKYGRKVWLWALSRAGGIWEDLLTDADGQYTELQSGRCFQQPGGKSGLTPFGHPLFRPGSTEVFYEIWGVLREPTKDWIKDPEPVSRPVTSPASFDRTGAAGLYLAGRHAFCDRSAGLAKAEEKFRAALAKDPWYRPALLALATIELRRGAYKACHDLCAKVLAIDTYDTDANYLDGFAWFAEGDDVTARDRLGVAAFDPRNRSAAYALIARIHLQLEDFAGAWAMAEKSLAANAANLDALLVKVAAMRLCSPSFASFARDVLVRYPLFHAVRYELEGTGWRTYLRNELPHQTCLEIGSWYAESGRTDAARHFFSVFAETDPLSKIRLAHLDDRVEALADAEKMSVAGVTPFRREELPALRWAAAKSKGWKCRYYLAVLLASFNQKDEAKRLFDTLDAADESVAFLVRAGQRTGAARLADLRRAAELGDSWRVGRALCRHFAETGEKAQQLAVAQAYIKKHPKSNQIQSCYAKALQVNGRNQACLDFLKGVVFLPAECGENIVSIWHAAQKALGQSLTYPANLGSGTPFPQE